MHAPATCDHRQTCGRIQLTLWGILFFGRNKRIPQLRADMSGCQEALLLTRQATPAMPLQEVAATGSIHAECPASTTKSQRSLSHTNLQSLQCIPEEHSERQSCSGDGARASACTSVQAQASVLLREKFPEQTQYIPSSLRRHSPQGSCDVPTVYSGQLMMPVL